MAANRAVIGLCLMFLSCASESPGRNGPTGDAASAGDAPTALVLTQQHAGWSRPNCDDLATMETALGDLLP